MSIVEEVRAKLKDVFYVRASFHIPALVLLCIAFFGVFEKQAYTFIEDVDRNSLEIMGFIVEIKQVLTSVGDIKIPFMQGSFSEAANSLDGLESRLMFSAVVINTQLLLATLSKSMFIKCATVALFLASMIRTSNQLPIKLLIIALAINPGLTLYSYSIKYLTVDGVSNFDDGLHQNLSELSAQLRQEQSHLFAAHKTEIAKIDDSKSHFKFIRRIASDISYDAKLVSTKVAGDYKELKAILNLGTKRLIKDVIVYIAKSLFFMMLLPLGYILLVYMIYQNLVLSHRDRLLGRV
ncbi:hypothetical protein NBRC116583_18540 [Arenicella sp. 4NH20-0111]|uniref:hypothetical protein n=1 Tax=Arenicella sp. 4NH20-0111 TaxID=3127648 RepID=UPI0031024D35